MWSVEFNRLVTAQLLIDRLKQQDYIFRLTLFVCLNNKCKKTVASTQVNGE